VSFRDFPDPQVPPSEFRCEAMTKPGPTYQAWRRESHRCIRRATQSRAGRSVCSLHASLAEVKHWDGSPDAFPTPRNKESR
jgi:hypothetical protein